MKLKNKKRAYTLAEVMLVILILAIIFAAMAPIFTKRKITQYTGKYNVWSYSDRVSFDAFYNPGDPSYTGQLFFGVTPRDAGSISTTLAPLSKIVIRAGEVTSNKKQQRHIQFRYGRTGAANKRAGNFAGTWFVNRKNVFLGGSYNNLISNESNGARDNVAVGYMAMNQLTGGKNNVAIGYNTLGGLSSTSHNVAVGYQAGASSSMNVSIGAMAGNYTGISGGGAERSVSVGYKAGYNITGSKNLFVGAEAGGYHSPLSGAGNTAIGFNALYKITTGKENIAIGYNALNNLTTGNNNIAIGYNACSFLTTQSNKTCIGYNSGPKPTNNNTQRPYGGYNAENNGSAYLLWKNGTGEAIADDVERVYIGGSPRNYGGDAVLEIHNPNSTNAGIVVDTNVKSQSNTTTIINGNLIVRGRPYFTVGNTLHHFHTGQSMQGKAIYGNDADKNFKNFYYYGYNTQNNNGHKKFSGNLQSYELGSGFPSFEADDKNSDSILKNFSDGFCNTEKHTVNSQSYMNKLNSICSDRRLKNIGEKFTGGLNEINKLKIYNFTFKDDAKKVPQIGVMAQDLQKIFPNAVFKDENGYLKIRWDEMLYATINAIKELDHKIITLAKRTIKVETKISKLEKENLELKTQVESLTARINKLKAQ